MPQFIGEVDVNEEYLKGDNRPLLVVQRSCLSPCSMEGDWLHNNIFQSMYNRGKSMQICHWFKKLWIFSLWGSCKEVSIDNGKAS